MEKMKNNTKSTISKTKPKQSTIEDVDDNLGTQIKGTSTSDTPLKISWFFTDADLSTLTFKT